MDLGFYWSRGEVVVIGYCVDINIIYSLVEVFRIR